ncbi:MAG: transglutaminase family protein [Propionibacteriaceae bacterium]|nr:transglutaminase family protein [Propionibacteriaceae bacterium]
MRYHVGHVTRYAYDDAVEACYNRAYLTPRDTPVQTVLEHRITASPALAHLADHLDGYGNTATYLEIVPGDARELSISAESVVEVSRVAPDATALDRWTVAEVAAKARQVLDKVEHTDFTLPSPLAMLAPGAYARGALPDDSGLGLGLTGLLDQVASDFSYRPGATSVRSTLDDLLAARAGVCQDFAHLVIGVLRAAGLPARYVSGYLETVAPPGQPKRRGADASHAWAQVWTPDGWLDLDPTNHRFADHGYITTAWGRDFSDVSPLRGIVLTESETSTLDVFVDVTPLEG